MFTKMKIKPFLYIRRIYKIKNIMKAHLELKVMGHHYIFLFCYIYEILLKLYYNSMQD